MLVEGGLVTRLSDLKVNKVPTIDTKLRDAVASTRFLRID